MMLLSLFSLFLITIPHEKAVQFTLPSKDTTQFLENPIDMALDKEGNLYVLDSLACTVFVWDREGKFLRTIGKKGEGPGEFAFTKYSAREAFLNITDDHVRVFEGPRKLIHVYTLAGKPVEDIRYGKEGAIPAFFQRTKKSYVTYSQNYSQRPPVSELKLMSYELVDKATIFTVPEGDFVPRMVNGKRHGWTVNAFWAYPALHADAHGDHILVGRNLAPEFDLYDLDGKKIRTVRFKKGRKPVTEADREEFLSFPWLKGNEAYKAEFPEYQPYYTDILPLTHQRFLVLSQSPVHQNISGIMIDENGKTLGSVALKLGQGGRIQSINGRIFAAQINEKGDFSVSELKFPVPEG